MGCPLDQLPDKRQPQVVRDGSMGASREYNARHLFAQVWPRGMAFPPFAPWLAAAVTRQEAAALIFKFSVIDPGVASGSLESFADLVGKILNSDDSFYRDVRTTLKKEDEPPEIEDPDPCWDEWCETYDGSMRYKQRCCWNEDMTTYTCRPPCPSAIAFEGVDEGGDSPDW